MEQPLSSIQQCINNASTTHQQRINSASTTQINRSFQYDISDFNIGSNTLTRTVHHPILTSKDPQ